MFMVTTNDVPGYRITRVLGEVMGLTVRSTNFGQGFTAGFRSLAGGEIPEFTKVMYESRYEVMNRMWAEAVQRGANAIVAMRFDTDSIGGFSEVCAYGTAVVVEPVETTDPTAAVPRALPDQGVPAVPPAPPVAPAAPGAASPESPTA